MQSKLTLSIEDRIIKQAKSYTRSKGRSLSELIENYLKVVLEDQKNEIQISPAVKKLQGSIKLPKDFDYKKELTDVLLDKYLK